MYDVAVIGAGVIGGMIARALSRYQLKICIVEKENDVAMGASCANSGIVHAGFDASPGTLKAKLNVQGSQMMEQVAKELGVPYRKNGSLVVAFSQEEEETLKVLLNRGIENGVPQLKLLEKEELRRLEPNIGEDAISALYAPTGGIISPYELTLAAIGNAMDNGTELFRNFEVKRIDCQNGVYRICSEEQEIETKFVVNAAGIYADKIGTMIGDDSFTIHPRKGEYILLDQECGTHVKHTIFGVPGPMGKGILVSPTAEGNLLLGPTSADGWDKEDHTTTMFGFDSIEREATMRVKGIALNKRITSFCGVRAVGSTGDFIIHSPKEQFLHVAGIESPGLTASPAIGEYVVTLLKEQGLPLVTNENYCPVRSAMNEFRCASIEEKNEKIKKDPSFGKIVCRCEGVTEGEIIEAIRNNPGARDLDGIKRRTRAQMGRCQGGFCMPTILELLSRELEIGMEQVTKFGKNSQVIRGKTK